MKRVIFIRHGETVDNARGVAQGWSDSPLSELGQSQARLVARRLGSLGLTHLFSSTLPRAVSTAQAISEATGLPFETLEDFREMNCGTWEGMSFELVRKNDPGFHQTWSSDPAVACPGGESFVHVRERLRAGLAALAGRLNGDSTVGIVSHGTAIRIAATEMLGLPIDFARQFVVDNTSINIFDRRSDGKYVLKIWNDTTHCS